MAAFAETAAALCGRWESWFAEAALPFWRERGWNPATGLAYERLDLGGVPDRDSPLRVRTQARQIFALAHAERLGVARGAQTEAEAAFAALLPRARAPDGHAGWVHVLAASGAVADPSRDLYDHAFVLLMLAHLHGGGLAVDDELAAVLAALAAVFEAPHGGHAETGAGGTPRRQNPHMHLFEAFLALFEETGDRRFLARADALYELFRTRFVDAEAGIVREFFATDWSLLPDDGSDWLEPGHLMEWVWLLRRYARHRPVAVDTLCARLFARGEALGRQPPTAPFLLDAVAANGTVLTASRRLWVQTEYLKALLVQARATDDAALAERCRRVSDALFTTYLGETPAGTWRDRFGADGALAVDHIPASTLYHLLGVLTELRLATA